MLEIFELFAKHGLAGLVILALLIIINYDLRAIRKQNAEILQAQEIDKSEFKLAIIQAKNCILKMFYDEEVLTDRRKRRRPVDDEKRGSN